MIYKSVMHPYTCLVLWVNFTAILTLTVSINAAPVRNPHNGHFYEAIYVQGINWFDSKSAAESSDLYGVKGHLATISSQSESDFIADKFGEKRAWIDGFQNTASPTYSEPSGGWEWNRGESFNYTNWYPGEPNDFSDMNLNEDGIEVYRGTWNDYPRTKYRTYYIVEYNTSIKCSGVIYLASQQDVDNFDCDTVIGSLSIGPPGCCRRESSSITNLNGLSNLTFISKGLSIAGNSALNNIDGLSSLTSAFSLNISNNGALTNLDGLSDFTLMGGGLVIRENSVLANLDSLSAITSASGVIIDDNSALTNIDGLSALSSVRGDLNISNNSALTNLDGLSDFHSVGRLNIKNNSALTNINGLDTLTSVRSNLNIVDNGALKQFCGLFPLLVNGVSA